MDNPSARRPSPAFVLAALALFVSLGGVAAGLPGKKVIDRNDLKPNVVDGGNVEDGTLGGVDVGDDVLTGADIQESTLGNVATATFATSAGTASSANAASSAGSANRADSSALSDALRVGGATNSPQAMTSNNDFTDVTTVNKTVSAAGGRLLVGFSADAAYAGNNVSDVGRVRVLVDGTPVPPEEWHCVAEPGSEATCDFQVLTGGLSAGTHQIKAQFAVTDPMDGQDSFVLQPYTLWVIEVS
jgi:hypothetical protein